MIPATLISYNVADYFSVDTCGSSTLAAANTAFTRKTRWVTCQALTHALGPHAARARGDGARISRDQLR